MTHYRYYIDFLKDHKFIRWQLMPDEALDAWWQDFIEENPHLKGEMTQAAAFLKNKAINRSALSEEERAQLFSRIESSIEYRVKKTRIRLVTQLATASCAAVVLIIIGLKILTLPKQQAGSFGNQEQIVGKLLNNEEVQLIAGEEHLSFQQDIEVQINERGTATILQGNSEETTVDIAGEKLNKLIVPYGKRTQLNLSDGSRIWLNSGSVLEFPAQFKGQNREIRLASGEMYIEVTPDKKRAFYVHTSEIQIKVYGTKFNVSTYAGTPQTVVLAEGSVSLKSESSEEIFLSPDEQVLYSGNGTFSRQQVDATRIISWKDGYLSLERTPMTEVLKQVGRYYNLSFDYAQDVNLQKRTCTGKIYLSDNIDNVMTTISILSSTKYIKNNNQIVITHQPD